MFRDIAINTYLFGHYLQRNMFGSLWYSDRCVILLIDTYSFYQHVKRDMYDRLLILKKACEIVDQYVFIVPIGSKKSVP